MTTYFHMENFDGSKSLPDEHGRDEIQTRLIRRGIARMIAREAIAEDRAADWSDWHVSICTEDGEIDRLSFVDVWNR